MNQVMFLLSLIPRCYYPNPFEWPLEAHLIPKLQKLQPLPKKHCCARPATTRVFDPKTRQNEKWLAQKQKLLRRWACGHEWASSGRNHNFDLAQLEWIEGANNYGLKPTDFIQEVFNPQGNKTLKPFNTMWHKH